MKLQWRWIERGIFVLGYILGFLFFMRDEAKDEAAYEAGVIEIKNDVKELKTEAKRNAEYWHNQMEINGRVITYIDLDTRD